MVNPDTVTIKLPVEVARHIIRFINDPVPGNDPEPDWDVVDEACREALREYDGPGDDPFRPTMADPHCSDHDLREAYKQK